MDRRPDVFLLPVDSLRADAFADTAERLAKFRAAGYETVLVTDNPLLRASLGEVEPTGSWMVRLDEALSRSLTRVVERGYFDAVPSFAGRAPWRRQTSRRCGRCTAGPVTDSGERSNGSSRDSATGACTTRRATSSERVAAPPARPATRASTTTHSSVR